MTKLKADDVNLDDLNQIKNMNNELVNEVKLLGLPKKGRLADY